MTPVYTGYIYKNIISQTHTRIKCRVSYHICIIKYDNVLRHAASFCCFFWFWCCSFWFCFCFFWFCCCFFSFYFCFCSLLCLFCCWVKMTFTPPYVHFFSVDRVCHHHTYILLRSMYIQYSLLLLEKTIPASEYWYRCTVVLFFYFLFIIHLCWDFLFFIPRSSALVDFYNPRQLNPRLTTCAVVKIISNHIQACASERKFDWIYIGSGEVNQSNY